MTTQPFDDDAYWRDREQNEEWDAPAWTCAECGYAEYIGGPDDFCTRCGERNQA